VNSPKVAIDARLAFGSSTGDTSYWTGLIRGLGRIEHGLDLLLFSNAERPAEIPESMRWVRVEARSGRWWSLFAFPNAAMGEGADVIHTQYNLSPLVKKGGVTTIHDVSFFIGPDWFRPKDRWLLQRGVPRSAKQAARVITVSETSRGEIERYIPDAKGKVAVTPLACPDSVVAVPREEAARHLAQELGLTSPFLLSVGTLWPRKNARLAIEAASLLDPALPHKLVLTGKAGWGELGESDRVVRTGFVSEHSLNCLYSAAELYVCPSLHEGFGLPVLEAFRCGCPVVCSTGGALPEVAGDAAMIVPGWDPREWADAIQGLLADSGKMASMRELGRRREREFSWEATARLTAAVYREVAE